MTTTLEQLRAAMPKLSDKRVLRDGTYQAAGLHGEAISARLKEFAASPAKIAADHDRLTGRCCFCNTVLSNDKSTAVGYGETCANHYGLPWGQVPRYLCWLIATITLLG